MSETALINIQIINQKYFLYTDLRSVKKALTSYGLSIIRLGKGLYVIEDDFRATVAHFINKNKLCNLNGSSDFPLNKNKALGKAEKDFLNELDLL